MRLTKPLLGLAALSLAAMAAAQSGAPPAEPPPAPAPAAEPAAQPPAEAPPQRGLSGLEDTVSQLRDEPAPATETPPEAPSPAPALPPAATPPPAPAAPARPLTAEQLAELDAAVQRGRLLFAIARAGLVASQDMLSRVSDPGGAGIAGWVAEPAGNATNVTFYANGEGGAPPAAVYRVSILGGRVTSREIFLAAGARPPLGPHLARMAAARAATEALDHPACGGADFNVLVVPPAGPDAPIDVYQLSVPGQRGHYPVGGHYKSTIAPDGSVAASRGFTNACLDLDVPEPAAGQQPAPLAITHLLDPLPTEIHVFLALATGHPLVVVAGDPQRLFAVTGAGIGEIRN